MTRTDALVALVWLLLAGYVAYRGFTTAGTSVDIVFAAWLGGVLSTLCYSIIRRHRMRADPHG